MLDDDSNKQEEDEMIPVFSMASIDFDKDLIILKMFYISLSKEHTQIMSRTSLSSLENVISYS